MIYPQSKNITAT